MTTSLKTKFLSGGFSIQRNDMISIMQQRRKQTFQFMNSFNQTFTRIDAPAQAEFDRIDAYNLISTKRVVIGGTSTKVSQPAKMIYRNGVHRAVLTQITINDQTGISSVIIADGGSGYSPNTDFNINLRGGGSIVTNGDDQRPAVIKARTDGIGRLSTLTIEDAGSGYTAGDLEATVDESPDLGHFVVSFFQDKEDQSSTGIGAITSFDFVSGHNGTDQREGVWFVEQNTSNPITTDGSGNLSRFKIQVYCDAVGGVSKASIFEFGEGFAVGDQITIPQALLGNNITPAEGGGAETPAADLVIVVETVTDANQVKFDFGTVTWRSESFTPGEMISFEYFEDTNIRPDISNGMFRQLAEDMCLHPYANYYSSAWSKNSQRSATLTFNSTGSLEASAASPGVALTATLSNVDTGVQLSAEDAFQSSDVGKRIIEPYGSGTCVIESVDASGVATLSMLTTNYTNEEVNSWARLDVKVYEAPYWRLSIAKNPYNHTFDAAAAYSSNNIPGAVSGAGGFESQPYNIIYPFIDVNTNSPIHIGQNGQQNHREVKKCIDRIGDLFVIESEKGTDIMSSANEITPATTPLPTSINLPQPVKDKRKPQKWRLRFYYDQRDEYIYVNAATDLQIKDNGDITKGQGRDGIKQGIFRQPGEMSEIYHNFSNDTNKAKSGFFRRQGKTTQDVESAYPMSYRLSCTDHGTGLFMFDHASVDQDDDYAWFTIQRHVNNISGKMEMEDGKSPVHCLYSPSKRPEEASEFNVGYYASVDTQYDPVTGSTLMTSKTLNELEVFDVNGRKLQAGLPVESSIKTNSNPVASKTTAYGSGNLFDNNYTSRGIPLTDASTLGTDPTAGISITNDRFSFPAINNTNYGSITKTNIDDSLINVGVYSPAVYDNSGTETQAASYQHSRSGFSLSFGNAHGTNFVPVGQYITGLSASNRYTGTANYGSVGKFTQTPDSGDGAFDGDRGLENFNSARNQQQGPAELGLTLHRVRHRSAGGIDTYLDKNKDVKIIDKVEEGPQRDGDGRSRNLPLVSNCAVFTPTSVAAKNILSQRKILIVHYTEMLATVSVATGTSPNFTNVNATTISNMTSANDAAQAAESWQFLAETAQTANTVVSVEPLNNHPSGGSSAGYSVGELGPVPDSSGGFRSWFATVSGSGGTTDIKVGDVLAGANIDGDNTATTTRALRVDGIAETFPMGDQFIYEYAWLGAGYEGIYANFYGRSGTASRPLFETNRLKVFVDSLEAEAAILGQNYSVDAEGKINFGTTNTSLEYFGTEKAMYAYNLTNDTLKFAEVIPDGVIVKISYEPYADVEENDSGTRTYLIKVPEDRDIPSLWHDVHREAKGIYRFCVREIDVLKPWDYHVSAVIPQIDSPACINPVEQLSITQDKTIVFNFPSPLASQRFIYSDAELDIIAVASANSSTQSGLIKTSSSKFDLDGAHSSDLRLTDAAGVEITKSTNSVSAKGAQELLNYRREYFWHNYKKSDTTTDAIETIKSTPSRTYMGMASTKPHGNGMRIFFQVRGGSIRPLYSDYTPREIFDVEDNFPTSPSLNDEATLGGVKYVYLYTDNDGTGSGGKEPQWVADFTSNFDSIQ